MRAVECAPGTAIVAGDTFRLGDLLLGFAVRIEHRYDLTTVIDHNGCRWLGVTVLRPGEFWLVEAVSGGVPYAAARPLQGHSQAPELALAALRQRLRTPAGVVGTSTGRHEKRRVPAFNRNAPFHFTESGAFSNQLMLATLKGSRTSTVR